MIIKALRIGLGQLIIFLDWISRPAKLKRTPQAQTAVEQSASNLALYQFHACPFCLKTPPTLHPPPAPSSGKTPRRTLHKLNVPVALRDAKNDVQARSELEQQGGKIKVPCLRIEENGQSTWLYESKAIIAYLDERFAGV